MVAPTVECVKPVDQIRRENLEALIKEAGSAARLSALTGVPQPYISQVRRGVAYSADNTKQRVMGNTVARRLEKAMGKPQGWMDADHASIDVHDDLSGREGQLIALFRLLAPAEQVELVGELTRRLRKLQTPVAVAEQTKPLKH